MTSDIDFVIIWVDGADPEWQKQRAMYRCDEERATGKNGAERYRDWGILRYWFRAVGKYAPWVRKIHFVTCGQLPEWLNINHPKINFVRHEDYIPHEWLPTFSSHCIELNLFRIKDLSEKFVYFNDDMLINAPVKPEDFFVNNLPCSTAGLIPGPADMGEVKAIAVNDIYTLKKYFYFPDQFRKNFFKWINLRYGLKVFLKTLHMLPYALCNKYLGYHTSHAAMSYLKSTFIEVWNKESKLLERTSSHKFRDISDVNQWLMEWYQVLSGRFYPRNLNFSYNFGASKMHKTPDDIRKHKHKVICINDTAMRRERYEKLSSDIRQAYQETYPDKSEFEKS